MSTTRTSSDPLLNVVSGLVENELRVQVAKLHAVLDWATAHLADEDEAGLLLDPEVEPALHLAGPGAPVVGEYAALDLAAALGMSSDGGLRYLGRALELCYRLPQVYAEVVKLRVPVWRAFQVADHTMSLPVQGATHVDRAIARFLHACSWAQVERCVDAARAAHDPAEAERRRELALENRRADVWLSAAGVDGTVEVTARVDLDDALDLEHALRDGAKALADLGSSESLDVRRAKALGDLARGQAALDLDRAVTLYVHLTEGSATGLVDNTQTPVLLDQVRQWCQTVGTKVTVKPVIDLKTDLSTESYEPTGRIREHVTLRDGCCVFPGCHRRRVDLDHVIPYDSGGPTATSNLAMLCRRHHRAKTHSAWTYQATEPGLYQWTSPTGQRFTVDRRRRP